MINYKADKRFLYGNEKIIFNVHSKLNHCLSYGQYEFDNNFIIIA